MTQIKQPLSNVQLELLKTFSYTLSDEELLELKEMLVAFFAKRLVKTANKVWDDKGWSNEMVDRMLNTKMRKAK